MEAENLEFFPVNRALALADETHDETDYKLDELIAQVDLLVRKQREQVTNIDVLSLLLVTASAVIVYPIVRYDTIRCWVFYV